MTEDWQFWITSAIAIAALLNSMKARKDATNANEMIAESQRKSELNQYYPPLSFRALVENDQIRFLVKNESPGQDTIIKRVKFFLNLRVGQLRSDDEHIIEVEEKLSPNSEREILCSELNDTLRKIKNLIITESPEKVSIYINAFLESKPPIYECEVVRENLEASFSHDSGSLKLVDHTR